MYLIILYSKDNPSVVEDQIYIDSAERYQEYWNSYKRNYPGKITGYELKEMFIPERKIKNKIQGTSYKMNSKTFKELDIIFEELLDTPLQGVTEGIAHEPN